MIDLERQRQRVEALKRKLGKSPKSQSVRVHWHRSEEGETDEQVDGTLGLREGKEGDMWEARSRSEVEADERASEDGEKRLAALEFQLRAEEEQREIERARLRAEELKRRIQERERGVADRSGETISVERTDPTQTRPPIQSDSSQIYLEVLHLVFRDGRLSKTESEILKLLRDELGVTDEEHQRLQQKVQLQIYSEAMACAWHNGVATQEDFDRLDDLRERLNISADEHMRLERQVRRQMLQRMVGKVAS